MLQRSQKAEQLQTLRGGKLAKCFGGPRGLAAMPEDGLAGVSGSSVLEQGRVSVDSVVEAQSPERCGAPFPAGGQIFRTVIRQTFTHVMEHEVGVGMDRLVPEFHEAGLGTGGESFAMAGGALKLAKERFTLHYGGVIERSPRRGGEGLQVGDDALELDIADFRRGARVRDPHVLGESGDGLLAKVGHVCLPSESSQAALVRLCVPNIIRLSGLGEEVLFINGLQQAQAKDRGGKPEADQSGGGGLTPMPGGDFRQRLSQGIRLAVRIGPGRFLP